MLQPRTTNITITSEKALDLTILKNFTKGLRNSEVAYRVTTTMLITLENAIERAIEIERFTRGRNILLHNEEIRYNTEIQNVMYEPFTGSQSVQSWNQHRNNSSFQQNISL